MADFEFVFDERGEFKKAKKGGRDAVDKGNALDHYTQAQLNSFPKKEFILIHGSAVTCIVHGGRLYCF